MYRIIFKIYLKKCVVAEVFHRFGTGWIPIQCMWDLWWKHWYWTGCSSECLSFSLSVPFHHCSVLSHLFIHSSIHPSFHSFIHSWL